MRIVSMTFVIDIAPRFFFIMEMPTEKRLGTIKSGWLMSVRPPHEIFPCTLPGY